MLGKYMRLVNLFVRKCFILYRLRMVLKDIGYRERREFNVLGIVLIFYEVIVW